jgi:hypothetical protein
MGSLAENSKATQQTRSAENSLLDHSHGGPGPHQSSFFHLQHTIGNQAMLRLLQRKAEKPNEAPAAKASPHLAHDVPRFSVRPAKANAIQTKLTVGAPGDEYEQEADRVAQQVMSMASPGAAARPPVTGAAQGVQRNCSCGGTCAKCSAEQADEEHGKVQRKPTGPQVSSLGSSPANSGMTAPPIVHDVLNSPGRPLDSATRAFMEPRFGYDFGSVRLHTGGAARSSAAGLGAQAYTVGPHVVLRDESPSRELLAHELTHVVQQASGPATLVQRGPGGGQGDQKFFNPSRGPLTGAEKAKLLALRRSLNLPDTPTPSDTSIVGILVTETGEEIPFHSGERGGYFGGVRPADVKGGPGSGTNRINRTHVETWAANAMRQRGLKRGVLLIELEPCAVCGGYGKGKPTVDTKVPGVSAQLPGDTQLIVVDGEAATYFRQTPTDPQRPTTGSSKPPVGPTNDDPPGGAGTGKSPQVKGQGGSKPPAGTDVDPGAAGAGKSPQVKGQGGGKPPAGTDVDPGAAGAGKSPPVKGQGGVKAPTGTDVDPGAAGAGKSPQVKGQGGVKAPTGTDVDPGAAGAGKSPQVKGQVGVKAPTGTDVDPGAAGAGKSPQVKGQGGVKAPVGTDVDPGAAGKTGGTAPAQKTTGQAPASGGFGGVGIQIGVGVATVGIEYLSARLRAKVDAKIAARQVEAFMEVARKKINANPDGAVKKMMVDPDKQVYAWIHLENSVIMSLGVDPSSGDPTLNSSSPIFDLGPIEYESAPVPPELVKSFPRIGGGGLSPTVTSTIIIDVPLKTPPLDDLIGYAKTRNMPLDDLYVYALRQLQAASSSNVSTLETRVRLLEAYQAGEDAWNKLDAEYKKAEKRHDVKLQVSIWQHMTSITQSQMSLSAQLNSIEKRAQTLGENVEHWRHIVDLTKPANAQP